MVCAPSNTAVDVILSRISLVGLYDYTGKASTENLDGKLLRLIAAEQEPSKEIKKHTLDERLKILQRG